MPQLSSEGIYTDDLARPMLLLSADPCFRDHVYMFPHGRSLPLEAVTNLRTTMSYHMFGEDFPGRY